MKLQTKTNVGRLLIAMGTLMASHTTAWATRCLFNIQYKQYQIQQFLSSVGTCPASVAHSSLRCECGFYTDPTEGVKGTIGCYENGGVRGVTTGVNFSDGAYSIASYVSDACTKIN